MTSTAVNDHQQPWLHDLEIAVLGNETCLSDGDGTIGAPGTGFYCDDRRVLSVLDLTCDGVAPATVAASSSGGRTSILAVARHLGTPGPDPTVEIHRDRVLRLGGLVETVTVRSRADSLVTGTITVRVAGDGADLAVVKGGGAPAGPLKVSAGADSRVTWEDGRHRTVVTSSHGAATVAADGCGELSWEVSLEPGTHQVVNLVVEVARTSTTPFDADPGAHLLNWAALSVRAQDRRLDLTCDASFADLRGLALSDPESPQDVFAAAGTPWYLTLFGRDALWTARLALPFGTDLAAGTLRTLARRQGRVDNLANAEEPGKILHEVRRGTYADPSSHLRLPPIYFGTVDATPLWISLLHDAWRWGMPSATVSELRPSLDGALGWMRRSVDTSADGFLRYVDVTGSGLANQGWKDSGDAMRHRDGSIAGAPIALVETQAYAVQAAFNAADLLEQVSGDSGDELRTWATALAHRVREQFWVSDGGGPYLAMALDGAGRPVDGVGSNMGHVLGTGMLTADESALVARRLADPDLLGPFGIGTLSRSNPAYNPIGYHTGSVWTHDTAICALGLVHDGHREVAARVLRSLVDAASHFEFRLPELYGGEVGLGRPVPYPASCRPQAWSAASAAAIVSGVLGIRADVPGRTLTLNPLRPGPFGELSVTGLTVGGEPCEVRLDASGAVTELKAPSWLDVTVND
ncbi:amylo-alpha-1,6-glucosidase [Nocardioides sp.]|uniref:amylo-alpha-1,6-glucosidase n=1 Tax=Nocardioides sp. TaxID=35761 RepID=UPI003D13FDEB